DDILIWGTTRQEQDERLRAVLEAARNAGLTFNAAKCKIGVTKISFLGDVISEEGIRPSPGTVSSVLDMPAPTDKLGVQRMLGVVNYFGKFLPALAEKTKLMRQLIKKDTMFEWSENHAKEWNQICKCLSMQPVLAIFDPRRDTKVTSDASQNGIGSALLQRYGESWKPVAYASRVLTDAQKRYAQIEKEAMAVVCGCEKFHHFVYGRKVILETDHRPLIAISQKAIGDMPPRLQRFFLRLLKYDFQLQFIPGKQLVLADMLSRTPVSSPHTNEANEDVEVHEVRVASSLVSEAN
ncbi:MAG: ribonuclease H family protein, partial [Anaplasma sp.]|nr:ribonuclease H family protein [Anaplasma sp.]